MVHINQLVQESDLSSSGTQVSVYLVSSTRKSVSWTDIKFYSDSSGHNSLGRINAGNCGNSTIEWIQMVGSSTYAHGIGSITVPSGTRFAYVTGTVGGKDYNLTRMLQMNTSAYKGFGFNV